MFSMQSIAIELVHDLIFFYFHKRRISLSVPFDHRENTTMMNQELQQITHRSDMYDIVSENWLHMETVLKETPFMSRYDHAEERRSALSVLWTYFDRNCELLSLLNLEEFKKSTNQLLNDFLGERLAELLYLVVPMKKENICMDCVDLEISNQIQELVRKKPKVQAIPFKENYSQEPLWLNDDILSHVLSYLIFPREMRSISLTCKRLYYFLHYSTNFSWISHLTLPNQGKMVRQDTVVLHDSLSVDVVSFIQRLFKTYQGFTNISSISKIFNYFHEHPENGRNTFLLHKLLKKEIPTMGRSRQILTRYSSIIMNSGISGPIIG
ncbi:hypothetical protein C9374_002024 [Naegleria lovaniensis]|uniref:F-box domain-containing protein n=1 Tax=Naegleria lovaniensis TaxID=51637 RepID=A0AA88GWF2_NAELO|nr:uncharacterized protein C9374_002024 [Naegleria lovaniensis]KAG2386989.1 hypothetical protein C9374_002024 [Naegleria lovaniensis]